MPFKCPACDKPNTLAIKTSIELPPDSWADEITLQVIACSSCAFEGIAVYQESRRGSLVDDNFTHTGYYADRSDVAALREMIKACPERKNKRCSCKSHQALQEKAASGRWDGLSAFNVHSPFHLQFSR